MKSFILLALFIVMATGAGGALWLWRGFSSDRQYHIDGVVRELNLPSSYARYPVLYDHAWGGRDIDSWLLLQVDTTQIAGIKAGLATKGFHKTHVSLVEITEWRQELKRSSTQLADWWNPATDSGCDEVFSVGPFRGGAPNTWVFLSEKTGRIYFFNSTK